MTTHQILLEYLSLFFRGISKIKSHPFQFQCVILLYLVTISLAPSPSIAQAVFNDNSGVDYDIVYVRYPAVDPGDPFVTLPQGEKAYAIAAGADLMLLRPDGSEVVLVDCTVCSIMDPFISYDGRYVYYSHIEEADRASASWLYKINLSTGAPYTPIRLTFNNGFDSANYAGNTTSDHDQASMRGIRDMAPIPLSDGRIMFTSNRSALTAFDPGANAAIVGSIQQLYIMDDHEGAANTVARANMHRVETGSLHLVQHPIQLLDGRILFSTWQDVGNKFLYAMTPLFTVHPDGSNMKQFTEPHDHHKNVEHFVTQLADEQIITGWYYPSFDYGFGALLRYPISDASGIDYLRGSIEERQPFGSQYKISYREFDRKGMTNLTPHTSPSDTPAPNLSGKYSMPSATVGGDLLVAYSTGSVNHFDAACARANQCESLKSGIYLIRSAATSKVNNPNELVKVKDDPAYNEIWPRAVVPFQRIYGVEKPAILPSLVDRTDDNRLADGEAAALIGTSSMYNRDPSDRNDRFQSSTSREGNEGNWTIQGAEAGIFTNDDIYAVRIITTPPKPFTKPISIGRERAAWDEISRYLDDDRIRDVVARYGSLHNERWEVLAEFPLTHKGSTDTQGNPDSSWIAKIPAETPFFIQTLDRNGMTIISELAWRALKPGENRTDCGGCHAHSIATLPFSSTQAGKAAPIRNVAGIDDNDSRISGGMWDLTSGAMPLLSSTGVSFINQRSLDVEFRRDVNPILSAKCISCHTSGGNNGGLVLDGVAPNDAWGALTDQQNAVTGRNYVLPQRSKYIRIPQARESLLVWVAYGGRLDGRTNSSRTDDVDYPDHPVLNLSDAEKRTIARWVDLGSPIDFPNTNGFGYTDDNQLPIINVFTPKRGYNETLSNWTIGVIDSKSGIDISTLQVSYTPVSDTGVSGTPVSINIDVNAVNSKGVITLPVTSNTRQYIFEVSVKDNAGNINTDSRFVNSLAQTGSLPGVPTGLTLQK